MANRTLLTTDVRAAEGMLVRPVSQVPGTPGRTLADRLDHLLRTVHPVGRGEYSLEEVARGIRAQGGPTVSASYLWLLRKGLKDNPTMRHLEALAGFFGVPPAYFFDDALSAGLDEEMHLLVALRQPPVQRIAVAAAGLSSLGQCAVEALVGQIREIESQGDGRKRVKVEGARPLPLPVAGRGADDGHPSDQPGRDAGAREATREGPDGSQRASTRGGERRGVRE